MPFRALILIGIEPADSNAAEVNRLLAVAGHNVVDTSGVVFASRCERLG
jgi:hypothetical protein